MTARAAAAARKRPLDRPRPVTDAEARRPSWVYENRPGDEVRELLAAA